jgi:5-methylcytosine-specific restriction endonuclease McrA
MTPWMDPHDIVPWQDSICKLIESDIEVLHSYEETVSSPSVSFLIPSVARLTRKMPYNKKGVKFSRNNILTRDGFRCQYCGNYFSRRQLNYDHVVPRDQGGKTNFENIVTSCYPCNAHKRNRTPEQAGMRLLKQPYKPKSMPLTMPAISLGKAPAVWEFYLRGTPYEGLAFG